LHQLGLGLLKFFEQLLRWLFSAFSLAI